MCTSDKLQFKRRIRWIIVAAFFIVLLSSVPAVAASPFNPDDLDYWSTERYLLLGSEWLIPDFRLEYQNSQAQSVLAWPFAFHLGSMPVVRGEKSSADDSVLRRAPLMLNFTNVVEIQWPLDRNARGVRGALGARVDLVFRTSPGYGWSQLLSVEGGGVASVRDGLGWYVGGGFGVLPEFLAPMFLFPHSVRLSVRRFQTAKASWWEITPFDFVMALPGAEWF